MRLKWVQLQFKVPQIPKSHRLQKTKETPRNHQFQQLFVTVLRKMFREKEQPHLICRASGQDELAVGVEGQTVDLCSVSVHCVAGLRCIIGPCVPALHTERKCWDGNKQTKKTSQKIFVLLSSSHHEFLVISYWSKQGLMQKVPGNILHNSSMACEDGLGIHNLSLLGNRTDVPKTDSLRQEGKMVRNWTFE